MADIGLENDRLEREQEASAWMTIMRADTGEPFGDPPARIHLLSRASKRWKEAVKAYEIQKIIARQGAGGQLEAKDVEDYEAHRRDAHAQITLEWENLERYGEPLACTPANMDWLYSRDWIMTQLILFTANRRNYIPNAEPEAVADDPVSDAEKKSASIASGSSAQS